MAWRAAALVLIVPLLPLGASAARFECRRRDERLASLRSDWCLHDPDCGLSVADALVYSCGFHHRSVVLPGADFPLWRFALQRTFRWVLRICSAGDRDFLLLPGLYGLAAQPLLRPGEG